MSFELPGLSVTPWSKTETSLVSFFDYGNGDWFATLGIESAFGTVTVSSPPLLPYTASSLRYRVKKNIDLTGYGGVGNSFTVEYAWKDVALNHVSPGQFITASAVNLGKPPWHTPPLWPSNPSEEWVTYGQEERNIDKVEVTFDIEMEYI